MRSFRRRSPLLALAASLTLGVTLVVPLTATSGAATTMTIAVSGAHLVNASGQTTRLLGVDRSGTEYACEQGWGIFDGPHDATSVAAMAAWHINAVRLPINEGCWLDLFTTSNDAADQGRDPAPFEGAAYRSAIESYVALLHRYHLAVILDLHATVSPEGLSVAPMADAAHSPAFWRSLASTFKSTPGLLFDLYNEPHDISWSCWLKGCLTTTSSGSYRTAGMQSLVDAVRSTGARQPLMIGGLGYSSNESGILANLPHDPLHQLIVSFHTYNFSGCATSSCWHATIAPLAKVMPVVTGEFGEDDCSTPYANAYMRFADTVGVSYLGWTWDAISPGGWSCDSGPSLIDSYTGTPSPYGVALHSHLATLATTHSLPAPW